ncbi:hypothetical protein [Bradyrhizobium sp.]|uniref:hypothetical protein n=1 Tax=Bradyrhizobium sp. TaxID=376 RepID=UPI003C5E9C30
MTQHLAPASTSTYEPLGPIDRKLSNAVAAILNSVERVDGQTVARQLPTPELRQAVAARIDGIRRTLSPLDRSTAEKERAARAIAAMLSGWINARVADPQAKVATYVTTLADLPCWAVQSVCADLARGRVEGVDPDYPPSAARLHQLVEKAIAPLRKEAYALDTVNALTLEAKQPMEQERKRIALQLLDLRDRLERGNEEEHQARQRVKFEQNAAALTAQRDRVGREYAAFGLVPPSPLALSMTARRDMALRDEVDTFAPAGAVQRDGRPAGLA